MRVKKKKFLLVFEKRGRGKLKRWILNRKGQRESGGGSMEDHMKE